LEAYVSDVSDNSHTKVLEDVVGLDPFAELGVLGKVDIGADDGELELGPVSAQVGGAVVPLMVSDCSKVVSKLVHHRCCDIALRKKHESKDKMCEMSANERLKRKSRARTYFVIGVKKSTLKDE